MDSNILLDISAIARHSAVVPSWDPLHLWRCGCFNRICDASHHWFWLCSFCRVKVTTLHFSFSLHLFNCSFPCKTSNPMQSFYVCALFDLSLRHWKLRKLMLWGMPTRCGRRTVAHQRSGKAGRGCSVAQAQGCHGNLSLGASVHFQSKDDCCLKWWILFFGQGKNQDAVMIRVPLSIPYVLLGCASQLICGYYMLINYRYPDVPS